MVASILERTGARLVHNRAGANMAGGVASALADASRKGGRALTGDFGLFEVDEFWLGPVVEELEPRAMLLGNLFRDQLDRYGELETIADRWAEIVKDRAGLVLNADDPLVADLGRHAPEPDLLRRRRRLARAAGAAARLGLQALPPLRPRIRLLRDLSRPSRPLPVPELRPGAAGAERRRHRRRAARHPQRRVHAARAARRAASPRPLQRLQRARRRRAHAQPRRRRSTTSSPGLQAVEPAFGRAETLDLGRPTSILLVKNPAGANEVLRTLALEGERARPARRAQRPHRRRPRRVLGLGRRLGAARRQRAPLHRLRHPRRRARAADEVRRPATPTGSTSSTSSSAASTPRSDDGDGPLYVVPTYTALLELRELLTRRGQAEAYWR